MALDFLQPVDREYAAWLGDVERRVILPLKYLIAILCAIHWLWLRNWVPPSTAAFGILIVYLLLTLGEHYLFARDRITPSQVRPFIYGSFLLDAGFVAALVLADVMEPPAGAARTQLGDFSFLFIIVVLRGFALFRTRTENLFGFLLASGLFLGTSWLQLNELGITAFRPALQQATLLWGIMLLTQVFVGLVNERKEDQVRLRERMVRSASLAALGELSAGVAHEINNPIGIIKTYTDYLEKSVTQDDPLREDFEAIRKEAERCEEIVRRMLDFSNPQVQGFSSVAIRELVEETVAFIFHEGRPGAAKAQVRCEINVPNVSGDPVQLKQALMNILINARQVVDDFAVQEGSSDFSGSVMVEITRGTGPRPPVRITITDNGPGLSHEEAERVFEPFFTRRHKGTGLGLAITRRIVEAHNGSIRMAPVSSPGRGAVVTLEIPIEGEEQA